MDLDGEDREESLAAELGAIGVPSGHRGLCPLEDPDVKPITEEHLIIPHPGEPGVERDGTAAPLENPGRLEVALGPGATSPRRR